jgi:hypothetical protein
MRILQLRALAVFCAFATLAVAVSAAKYTAADFPLRVHIWTFSQHTRYWNGVLQSTDGHGRANLYENSQPYGFDFTYQCGVELMASAGGETYVARWKKPGRELEIAFPVIGGKPGDVNLCNMKVTLKPDTAYFRRNGLLGEEPASVFKKWMIDHQYDPEHGKDMPQPNLANAPAAPAAAPATAPSAVQPAPSATPAQ